MIFNESREIYGTRRIQRALGKEGIQSSRRRIKQLMNEQGLIVKTRKKFKVTTDSKHSLLIAENLLARDFYPAQPNQTYAGDITYISTEEGWLYLAVVIDYFRGKLSVRRWANTCELNWSIMH